MHLRSFRCRTQFPSQHKYKVVHGFGFESRNNDYKVVRLMFNETPKLEVVELYEFSTNYQKCKDQSCKTEKERRINDTRQSKTTCCNYLLHVN